MITFKTGDKIKAIKIEQFPEMEGKPNLNLHNVYEIQDICLDSKGNQHLDVGLRTTKNYVRSRETEQELPKNKKDGEITQWCHPSRFELV